MLLPSHRARSGKVCKKSTWRSLLERQDSPTPSSVSVFLKDHGLGMGAPGPINVEFRRPLLIANTPAPASAARLRQQDWRAQSNAGQDLPDQASIMGKGREKLPVVMKEWP